MRDLAAQEFLVALERLEHHVGVAAAERHHVNGGEFKVGRHAYLGNRNDVAFEIGVVNVTLRQNIGDGMAYGLADAQLPLRAAGGGTLGVVTGHLSKSQLSSSPAKAGDPVFRAQINCGDYWMPRFRGA